MQLCSLPIVSFPRTCSSHGLCYYFLDSGVLRSDGPYLWGLLHAWPREFSA
jgi:hypothetical protein